MTLEEAIDLIVDTANMLRGMTFDPAIPKHVKDALYSRIEKLDSAESLYVNGPDL